MLGRGLKPVVLRSEHFFIVMIEMEVEPVAYEPVACRVSACSQSDSECIFIHILNTYIKVKLNID